MKSFQFLGTEQTHAGLPDGMIILVDPGDIVALPYDELPELLWVETKKRPTVETPSNLLPAEAPVQPEPVQPDPDPDPDPTGSADASVSPNPPQEA